MSSNVFAPQDAPETGAFIYGFDELGAAMFRRPRYEDLDFGPVFGAYSTSATANGIGYGERSFVLDRDDGSLSVNDTVQIRAQGVFDEDGEERKDLWMSGIVTAKDVGGDFAVITVTVDKVYAEDDGATYYGWLISRIARQISGLPASAALGYSSDEFEIPSVGETITTITNPNKIFSPNAVVLFKPAGTDLFFVAIVRSYDIASGTLQSVVIFVSPEALLISPAEAYEQWFITAVDLNVQDADLVATSSSEVTIEGGGTKTFSVQPGKAFLPGGSVLISDIVAVNKAIWRVESYSGTNLVCSLLLVVSITTGMSDAWIVRFLDGPPALPELMDLGSISSGMSYLYIRIAAGVFADYGAVTDGVADSLDYGGTT